MSRTARCACESASITVTGEPVAHAVCHCDNCKRRTGSAFGVSAYFAKRDVVSVAGELVVYALHNTKRNEDQERHFCKRCGTTLFWYTSAHPEHVGIAAGCFPNDAFGEPRINASAARKLAWVTIPDHWHRSE